MTLIVLDGWGYSEATQYNAIHSASKPTWDELWQHYPHLLLNASGHFVGLPDGQMGNSEVGHMHLGAGRVIPQDFTRISQAIEDGEFEQNEVFNHHFREAARRGRAVHFMGLASPGGVHSHEDHILAAIDLAASLGVERIFLHAFLDGRDTPPKSAMDSIARFQQKFQQWGRGRIASMIGRYYAMDRNHNWDRTQQAWNLVVDGRGFHEATDPYIALDQAYARGETDEFVKATVVLDRAGEVVRMEDGDVAVFMNYRADRARQLTEAFIDPEFDHFNRPRVPELGAFITLTRYSATYDNPVAFPPQHVRNSFGEYVSKLGMRQLRIAETEKYAHVTFFFNGGEERVFEGEDRILVPSPQVPTYDLKPEMSAYQVTDRLVEAVHSNKYDVIICNYANADMVGHTGNFDAAVKAVEAVDRCLGRVVAAIRSVGGELLITADHGNVEQMRGVSTKKVMGQPHTAHTTNLVPLLYVGRPAEPRRAFGSLIDVAPTMLDLMHLEIPPEMTGESLFELEEGQQAIAPRLRLSRLLR